MLAIVNVCVARKLGHDSLDVRLANPAPASIASDSVLLPFLLPDLSGERGSRGKQAKQRSRDYMLTGGLYRPPRQALGVTRGVLRRIQVRGAVLSCHWGGNSLLYFLTLKGA